jgi:hypothetical protein
MKQLLGLLMGSLFLASVATAAGPKDYQVTGPVLDLSDDVITVQKGNEKWEVGRDKSTKIDGDLKKGSKVTIHYKMNATKVEVKDAGKAKTDTKTSEKTTKTK